MAASVTFGLGGFLAGVRAAGRRPAHAVAAAVAGYVIHGAFIVLARLIEAFGGPEAPALVPGTGREWVFAAGWAVAFALIGGLIANAWLSPTPRR